MAAGVQRRLTEDLGEGRTTVMTEEGLGKTEGRRGMGRGNVQK